MGIEHGKHATGFCGGFPVALSGFKKILKTEHIF